MAMCLLFCASMEGQALNLKFWKKKKTEVKKEKETDYDKFMKKKHETARGLFTLYKAEGKLYFELPLRLLGKEMLIGSTVTGISDNGNAIVGSKPQSPLHVKFTKNQTHVQLRLVNYDFIATESAVDRALRKSMIGMILDNQKIIGWNKDSTAVLFEMTDFFVGDNPKMSPFDENSRYAAAYQRDKSYKSDLSYLSKIKAFSDNVAIKSVLSYSVSLTTRSGQSVAKNEPFTVEMTRSIMLLKEKPYHPRMADYRIGFFYTQRQQLGDASATSLPVYYTNRWDLQPRDTLAWKRGEVVDVTKPIVFYVDNTFPVKWQPYIKQAVNMWSEVFEKECRLRGAVVAKDFPTAEQDPEFDPDNIKYNCIRYAPIDIENAMGPSWVDPRSGEILMASVYVYHNFIKLITNWLFVQTAAADPDVRTAHIPEAILGDAIRYVIGHEVGHCLGLMHNMGASNNFPVEKLRDPAFTRKYGTTPSIMDYARFNYVAQPGDKERGVKLTPPRFGVYDHYAIKWGYLPVFDMTKEEEEQYFTRWITDSVKANPWYRYGKQQLSMPFADPRNMNEDLGDDAVRATDYGIRNLKYIMGHMDKWLSKTDVTMTNRQELLDALVNQLALFTIHVSSNVSGYYANEVKEGDGQQRFMPLSKARQKEALNYLFKMYGDLDWLDNKALLRKLTLSGSPQTTIRRFIGNEILSAPIIVSIYCDLDSRTLQFAEAMDMVYHFVWNPTIQGRVLKDYEMSIQKDYLFQLMANSGFKVPSAGNKLTSLADKRPNPVAGFEFGERNMFGSSPKVTQADIYPYLLKAQRLLKAKVSSSNGRTHAHYSYLLKVLDSNMK
ncbi:MAG TPA: zinc-dependent metalloprotease [Prevotella sp.]